jgi:hypothetical protein
LLALEESSEDCEDNAKRERLFIRNNFAANGYQVLEVILTGMMQHGAKRVSVV